MYPDAEKAEANSNEWISDAPTRVTVMPARVRPPALAPLFPEPPAPLVAVEPPDEYDVALGAAACEPPAVPPAPPAVPAVAVAPIVVPAVLPVIVPALPAPPPAAPFPPATTERKIVPAGMFVRSHVPEHRST